jgi:hypothetical protein
VLRRSVESAPQKETLFCAAANAAVGHERPPAVHKNSEPFRRRTGVVVTDLPNGGWYNPLRCSGLIRRRGKTAGIGRRRFISALEGTDCWVS